MYTYNKWQIWLNLWFSVSLFIAKHPTNNSPLADIQYRHAIYLAFDPSSQKINNEKDYYYGFRINNMYHRTDFLLFTKSNIALKLSDRPSPVNAHAPWVDHFLSVNLDRERPSYTSDRLIASAKIIQKVYQLDFLLGLITDIISYMPGNIVLKNKTDKI